MTTHVSFSCNAMFCKDFSAPAVLSFLTIDNPQP